MRKKSILILIVLVACITAAMLTLSVVNARRFSERLWKESSVVKIGEAVNNPRGRMVDALIKTRLHPGMGRNEVILILGLPDEPTHANDDLIWYDLGANSGGMFIHATDHLTLEFNQNGVLKTIEVRRSD